MMRRNSVWKVLFVALAIAAVPAESRADDVADEADLHFQIGADRYRARDFRGALEHFLLSNRLVPNRNVVFNIARTHEQMRQFSHAFRYYRQALEAETNPEEIARLEASIERILPQVAVLNVVTDPPGATVYLNRKDLGPRGQAPRMLAFDPGTHTVIAELPGHRPAVLEGVVLELGVQKNVQLRLERVIGTLEIQGLPPSAEVRADDPTAAPLCVGACNLELSPGRHTLYVNDPGHEQWMREVDVVARKSVKLRPDLNPLLGSLLVRTDEREALVEVDGKPVGFTPTVIDVGVGTRNVRVSKPGFSPEERSVEVRTKERSLLEFEMKLVEEVIAASRRAESVDDAPGSVSLISWKELRAMGYPTIAEAVRGVRGVYVGDDRSYKTIGMRGLFVPGNYGNRVLVLLDGHPMNDNWIGSSYVDYDARTDLEDVERLEVVRGPGSVLYGTNAFSGVINVVSRGRRSPTGGSVGASTNESGVGRARAMANVRFGENAGAWASVSGARSAGRDFHFPEYVQPSFDPGSDGMARGVDSFESGTVTGQAWWGPLTFLGFFHSREKHLPTGAFDTIFADPRTRHTDTRGMTELRIEPEISDELQVLVRGHLDWYRFEGKFPYEAADGGLGVDTYHGTWGGGEGRVVLSPVPALRLTLGGEGQRHFRVDQRGENENEVYLDRSDPYTVAAGYGSIDLVPVDAFRLSAGTRFDWYSTFGSSINPRVAIIAKPYRAGNLKLLTGKAFRAPSIYELYYNDGGQTQNPSPDLQPEVIYSPEIQFTHRFSDLWTGLVAGYANYVKDLIVVRGEGNQAVPTVYENSPSPLLTLGAEASVRREWRQGWMVELAYAYQRSRYLQEGSSTQPALREVPNAPEHMGSLRASAPIVAGALIATTRLTVEGPRYDRFDREGDPPQERTDGAAIWDVVVSGQEQELGLRYAAGIYNAFDTRHRVPVSAELRQRTILQNGRTLLLSASVDF
jgi:outer membrane receptor protein involved in Fe transport